jgi:hypothetical protein
MKTETKRTIAFCVFLLGVVLNGGHIVFFTTWIDGGSTFLSVAISLLGTLMQFFGGCLAIYFQCTIWSARRQKAPQEALVKLDIIQDDGHWVGAKSKIIDSKMMRGSYEDIVRQTEPENGELTAADLSSKVSLTFKILNLLGNVNTVFLCRTHKGAWFIVTRSMLLSPSCKIRPVEESFARKFLEYNKEKYLEFFELPAER